MLKYFLPKFRHYFRMSNKIYFSTTRSKDYLIAQLDSIQDAKGISINVGKSIRQYILPLEKWTATFSRS